MATIFAAFGKTIGNNKGAIENFGIVGITIATEELGKFIFFYCPCDYPRNKVYGTIFIWGPAAILLIVGYLANRRTWRLTTGLCNRTQGIGKKGKRIGHFLFIFASIGVKAIIAPATWVVLAFLKGDYYACAKWPDPYDVDLGRKAFLLAPTNNTLPMPCMFNPNPAKFDASEAEVIARNLRAESHTIGWFYVSFGMLFGVCVMFCMRCRSKYSYEQSNYIDRYRSNEIKLFEQELDTKAEEQAKRIVEGYFAKPRAKEEWDQIAVINDKVTRSKRGKAIYSPLHKFVNKELRAAEEAGQIDAKIDLVSDAAMKTKKPLLKKNNKKPAPKNGSGSGGTAIVMAPIVTSGGKSKLPSKSVEMKKDTFAESPAATNPTATASSSTTVVVENEKSPMLPEVAIADPSKPSEVPPSSPPNDSTSKSPDSPHSAGSDTAPPLLPKASLSDSNVSKQPISTPSDESALSAPTQSDEFVNQPQHQTTPGSQSEEVHPPSILPSPHHDSHPASEEKLPEAAVKETSLGDFGGSVSREDLSYLKDDGEDDDDTKPGVIVFEGQELPSDEEEIPQDQTQDGGYEPLLENDDEAPLLTDD